MTTSTATQSWYRIENSASGSTVFLYDEVGLFGVSASEFTKDLRAIKAPTIDLHVSSPGGDIFDGMAIYNAIRTHPATVNVHIDGLAASAASFIAQAGDRISIARNAQMMVHEGHAVCAGDAADMRKCAGLLDKCSDNIASIYSERAGGTVEHWRNVMRAETWYTADEAVRAGLADEVSGATKPTNTWDLSVFLHAGREQAPPPPLAPPSSRIVGATRAGLQRAFRDWSEPLLDAALAGDEDAMERLRYGRDTVNAIADSAGLGELVPSRGAPGDLGEFIRHEVEEALQSPEAQRVLIGQLVRQQVAEAFSTPTGQQVLALMNSRRYR